MDLPETLADYRGLSLGIITKSPLIARDRDILTALAARHDLSVNLSLISLGRTAPLKSFLLDQSRVAGVGNIYADEALWRARLHPLSPAGSMRLEHCEDLRAGIIGALEAGLRSGGASVDDYLDAHGDMNTPATSPSCRSEGVIRFQ